MTRAFVVGALAGGVAVGITAAWVESAPRADLVIDVSSSTDACCEYEVHLNESSRPNLRVSIRAGEQQRLRVPIEDSTLREILIRFGDVRGSYLTVTDMALHRDDRVIHHFAGFQTGGFAFASGRHSEAYPGIAGFRYTASTVPAEIDQTLEVVTVVGVPRWFNARLATGDDTLAALILLAGLVTALAAPRDRRALAFAISFAGVVALLRLVPAWTKSWGLRDSAAEAVGQSAFLGQWKTPELVTHVLVLVISVAVPAGVAAAAFRRGRTKAPRSARRTAANPHGKPVKEERWRSLLLPLGVLGILALFLVPDLGRELAELRARKPRPGDWDQLNLIYWDWLDAHGAVPVRDFFFPYGNRGIFLGSSPLSHLWGALNDVVVWGYVLVGIFLALGRFIRHELRSRFLFLSAVLMLGVLVADGAKGQSRYMGAAGLVLLFASIQPGDRLLHPRRLLFGIAWAHHLVLEPAVAVYAAPALVAFRAVDLVDTAGLRVAIRRLRSDAVILTGATATAAGVLALTGQLSNTIEFYRDSRALAALAAHPVPIADWIRAPASLTGFMYWALPVGAVLGAWGIASAGRGSRGRYGLVAALAIVAFMELVKQVGRPGNDALIWLVLLLPTMVWLALCDSWQLRRTRFIVGATLGVAAGVGITSGALGPAVGEVALGPSRLAGTVATLATRMDELQKFERERISASRFSEFTTYLALERRLDRRFGPDARVWILGDDPVLNVVLEQTSPWYYNSFYETSPVRWQRILLRQLADQPPDAVVFNPSLWYFDGVPNVTRVPLIFEWAVRHFVPQEKVEPYVILRPRRAGEPVALDFWRDTVGPTTDLGHLARISNLPPARCSPRGPCATFVEVVIPGGGPVRPTVDVPVRIRGREFFVHIATDPSDRPVPYVIPLDRVWFWAATDATSRDPGTGVGDVEGATIRVLERIPDPDRLY